MPAAELSFLFGESVPACTHRVDKHFEGYYTLQYMAAGGVDLQIGARRQLMTGRWFWSAYPGPRVRFGPAAGFASWVHRYLAFRGSLVWRWERDGLFPVSPCAAPGNRDFGPAFDTLLGLVRLTDRRSHLRAVHCMEGLLLDLADARIPNAAPSPWLDQALSQISKWAEATNAEPDYAHLARQFDVSPSTLQRRIVEATGVGPHGYLLQCRTALARTLLGETDLPLKAIAHRLGYTDVFFFSRQFHKLVGTPPATYRKSRQR